MTAPVEHVMQTRRLTDREREVILGGTARQLLKIPQKRKSRRTRRHTFEEPPVQPCPSA